MDISALRWLGIGVAAIGFGYIFIKLRYHHTERWDVVLAFVGAVLVLALSLFPSLGDLPAEFLSLDHRPFGRLMALLVLSNLALWMLLLYERGKRRREGRLAERVVRQQALAGMAALPIDPAAASCILVIIPAYEEAENLAPVLSAMPEAVSGLPVRALVVDDGSQDGTAERARELGAWVVSHPVNLGGGAALLTGYEVAKRRGSEVIVTMDADGQHDPAELSRLVQPILDDTADFVIGSRILGSMERYSTLRYLGVRVFSAIINRLVRARMTDCASGFRAFRVSLLRTVRLEETQYHTPEMIIEAAKRGLRISEVPIHIRARLSGSSKKGTSLRYAAFFARTIVKTWIR